MQILARLGDVLYWFACIVSLAVVIVPLSVAGARMEQGPFYALCFVSVVVWLIGRGCQYILRGV